MVDKIKRLHQFHLAESAPEACILLSICVANPMPSTISPQWQSVAVDVAGVASCGTGDGGLGPSAESLSGRHTN